jgi:hypothetical protein
VITNGTNYRPLAKEGKDPIPHTQNLQVEWGILPTGQVPNRHRPTSSERTPFDLEENTSR